MTLKYILYFLMMILIIPFFSTFAQDNDESDVAESENGTLITCGVERWAVKTCYDADTVNVNFNNIVPTTITYQRSLTAPTLPGDNTTRLSGEDTVFSLDCHIIECKLETDQDVHVVISTIGNTGETMVAEIVNPECPNIVNTSRYTIFKTLRDWFIATYNPTTSFKSIGVDMHITGIGFFDFLHGQTGIPPNGREIHPILTMSAIALPVELTSFTYKTANSSIKLEWGTATEVNNNHFEIERRDITPYWIKIGEVKGAGTCTTPNQYFFLDNHFTSNGKYYYRLKQVDNNGQPKYSNEIEVDVNFLPSIYSLENNFPNPFNPSTIIRYNLPFDSNVKLAVYNSLGQVVVNELSAGFKKAGTYDINFNAYSLNSGIYFYTIRANSTDGKHSFTSTKKMILMK
ncbi:MAG: T9SS type A sorting domain-containing protein [Ignavibacteriaceae bacterium]|nr:T9SS type A sorting domain-containing protein [Ignavibacteriaceae bacterium]